MRLLIALGLLLACGGLQAAVPAVTLPDGKAVHLADDALAALPRQSVTATAHGSTARYEGYDLRDVLAAAGVAPVASLRGKRLRSVVSVSAADGYRVVFALSALDPTLGNERVLLVDRQNGQALPDRDGPWRLVVPSDQRPARWARQVTAIAVSP